MSASAVFLYSWASFDGISSFWGSAICTPKPCWGSCRVIVVLIRIGFGQFGYCHLFGSVFPGCLVDQCVYVCCQSLVWHHSDGVPLLVGLGCCSAGFKLTIFFDIGLLVQSGSWHGLHIGLVQLELRFPARSLGLVGQMSAFWISCFGVRGWPSQLSRCGAGALVPALSLLAACASDNSTI